MQLHYILLYTFLALIGATVTGISSYVTNQTEDYQMFLVSSYYKTALCVKILGILVVIGSMIMLLNCVACSDSGWSGGIHENCCTFILGYCISGVIFIGTIFALAGAGIAAFIQQGNLNDDLKTSMVTSLDQYNQDSMVRNYWNNLQQNYQCCGVTDYKDWEKLWEASRVPDSCCQNKAYGCGLNFETEKIYIDGCLTSQVEQSAKNLQIIGVAAIVGAIGEAAVILLSILIAWCEDSPNRDCT